MSIELLRVERRVSAAAPRAERIERMLGRFRDDLQHRVRRVAALHPWVADLAVSFPALLFALAAPRKAALADAGLRAALAGAPLSATASAAGVPIWIRAFAPEAFTKPIPTLPDGLAFRMRIANHFPSAVSYAPRWIESVALAADVASDDVAIWMAREAPKRAGRRKNRYLRDYRRQVALWAWATSTKSAAGAFASVAWNAEMKWTAASTAAMHWSDGLWAYLLMGEADIVDAWLEPGEVDGYTFLPLRSAADLRAESDAMKNCVRTYGADIADNMTRVWSIRKDGERVATLSLRASFPDAPFAHIDELSVASNAAAPPEIWLAARRWLHAQDRLPADPKRLRSITSESDALRWRMTWRDYWLAKRRIPDWLPLKPVKSYTI